MQRRDNIRKLGYGGTKDEMERLIQDASKMTDVQEQLGVKVDASSMSFDNCVAAIHVMQQAMQVGGTTAREAATTIEGSVAQMKAAWENWLTGLGTEGADLSQLTGNLVGAFETMAQQVVPRVSLIVSSVVSELPGLVATMGPTLAQALLDVLGTALETVRGALPAELSGLVKGFDAIVAAVQSSGIGDTLANIFDGLGPAAQGMADSVGRLATDFSGYLGPALEAVSPLLQTLADTVALVVTNLDSIAPVVATVAAGFGTFSVISTVVPVVAGFVSALAPVASVVGMAVTSIAAGAPVFGTLAAAIGLVVSPATLVVAGIAAVVAAIVAFATNAGGCRDTVVAAFQAVCDFVGSLPETIGGFLQSVLDAITGWAGGVATQALQAGSQFLSNVGSFLAQLPGSVAGWLAGALASIGSFVGSCASNALQAGSQFLSGISNGFNSAVSFVAGIPGRVVSALGNVGSLLYNAGASILRGFLNGLKSMWSGVTSFVGGIADWIASHKGPIEYDRKLLSPHGKAIMQSLYGGLDVGFGKVEDLVSSMAPSLEADFGAPELQTNAALLAAAAPAAGTAAGYGSYRGGDTYNVNLSATDDARLMEAIDLIVSRVRRSAAMA